MASRRQPPAAPPGLWERPEMADALARRDMGAVVRVFRKWTGASQTDIGMLVGVPQPHISELERGGRHVTTLDLFERFAEGLGIPRGLLGLAESGVGERLQAGTNYRAGETDEIVTESHRRWLDTRRMLNLHRAELTYLVSDLYPASIRLDNTGVLIPEQWRLP